MAVNDHLCVTTTLISGRVCHVAARGENNTFWSKSMRLAQGKVILQVNTEVET